MKVHALRPSDKHLPGGKHSSGRHLLASPRSWPQPPGKGNVIMPIAGEDTKSSDIGGLAQGHTA